MEPLPIVDVGAGGTRELEAAGAVIDAACREHGAFLLRTPERVAELGARLDALAREFFALETAEKATVAMPIAGAAWRGWFPLGGELTSGLPDRKEGLYYGDDLSASHPLVRAGTLLHGANLHPARPAALRHAVDAWMAEMRSLATVVLRAMATGFGLSPTWFEDGLTHEPISLFRIFHYPAGGADDEWGVGTHTDYGLLTILRQDGCGGLQLQRTDGSWIEVPPDPDLLVCNLGDMLELMTGGAYRSTPHRVRNSSGDDRVSFPFFFDPGWEATVRPIPRAPRDAEAADRPDERWDRADPLAWSGTYGEYLTRKVGHVFPGLRAATEAAVGSDVEARASGNG